jgi:hypothetical protein
VAGIADLYAHVIEGVAPRFRQGVISGHCDCTYFVNPVETGLNAPGTEVSMSS